MDRDPLKEWLARADASAPSAAAPSDLADRTRHRAVRQYALRRRALSAFAAAAALALLTLAGLWLEPRLIPSKPPAGTSPVATAAPAPLPASPEELAALREKVKRLDAEAEFELSAARYMMKRERQVARLEELRVALAARVDPEERIAQQVDRAAEILVTRAERQSREPQLKASAAETYREVARYFPGSPWAEVARNRLSLLEPG